MKLISCLLLLLPMLPLTVGAQSLALPVMTPYRAIGVPQKFAIDPRGFLAQATPVSPQSPSSILLPGSVPSLSVGLGKGFAIGVSTSITSAFADVQRDWYNGMWLMGYGYEAFPFYHQDSISGAYREFAYIGAYNTFAVGDGKGVLGVDVGVHFPTMVLNGIGWVEDKDLIQSLPPWAQKLQSVTAIEVGVGTRLFGISQDMANKGIKKRCGTVGAHVSYPFDFVMSNWFNHSGSLAKAPVKS